MGVCRTASLADASCSTGWNIRRCGRRRFPQLCETIAATTVPDATAGPDIALWRHDQNVFKPKFSAARTWDYLRVKKPKVPWYRLVWFPQAVPRQAFLMWLAIQDRLSTGVRMRGWGIVQGCVFCGERDESRDHLYFACPYTFTVWLNIAPITPDWADTLSSILHSNRNRLDTTLLKLALQTSIYILWKERNSRRHGGVCVTGDTTSKAIGRAIKNRISSLKYKGNHMLQGLLRRWFEVHPS